MERDLSLEGDREFLLDPLEEERLLRCFGECEADFDDERLLERDGDLFGLPSLEFDLDLEISLLRGELLLLRYLLSLDRDLEW